MVKSTEHTGVRILTWRMTLLSNHVSLPRIYTCIKNCFQSIIDFIKIRKTQNNPALMASSSSVVYDLTFLHHFPENAPCIFRWCFKIQFPILKWDKHFQVMERIQTNVFFFFLKQCLNIIFKCNCILYSPLPWVWDEGSCSPLSPYIFFWISTNSSAQVFL